MVAYQPPDRVVLMTGASFRADPLIAAARRLLPVARQDRATLTPFGLASDFDEEIDEVVRDLQRYLVDPMIKKNDTPLQMADVAETMARVRAWLVELRQLAAIELSLDTPALVACTSPLPEIADGYPRDVLEELERRLKLAGELQARMEDVGVDDKFMTRGRKLAQQLRTAIGREDVDPANLQLKIRRHYMKKGALHALLKRIVRAGRYVFRDQPARARLYHLDEIESP